jgi:hypothetical protein
MTDRDNGGPAFPFAATDPSNVPMQEPGMTLRDWFAGQALAAVMGRMHENIQHLGAATFPSNVSIHAYRIADAMLEARK